MTTINTIIKNENIDTLYQPIVNLITGEVMAYEALSRGPKWSQFYSPVDLINEAAKHNLSAELEFIMQKKALENLSGLTKGQKLFINVNPNIMANYNYREKFFDQLFENQSLKEHHIVFELTERFIIEDYHKFNSILDYYKDKNYRFAIDDVGTGYSGLQTIKETKPHFIKIDMELIRDIDTDSFKEALINAFLNFSITTNIRLIAEGIETEDELCKLIEMGVHYGQGYFLQTPSSDLKTPREDVIKIIKNINNLHTDLNIFNDSKAMIGPISNKQGSIRSTINCNDVQSTLELQKDEGYCVTHKNIPQGIIMRENLLFILSSRYGLSLYAKKPISHIMDDDFLMVDYHSSISEVSKKAMSRERNKKYDIIVVTKNGEFYGTISIHTLLQNLISVETQNAKELNPLTRLPGNLVINRILKDMVTYKPKSCIVYLDFDYFKPYNDIYGFEYGDQFIKKVSEIILSEIKSVLPYNSFVGHIGGDDFIFIMETSREITIKTCKSIIDRFEQIKRSLYTPTDFERGYMIANNRNNQPEKFNLTTLSISGIYNNLSRFNSVEDLSKYMSLLKKKLNQYLEIP